MATNGHILRNKMLLVFGLLTGILGHDPVNETLRSVTGNQCAHVCPRAHSCILSNHDGRIFFRCVRRDGTGSMIPYEEHDVTDLVEIERIVQTLLPPDGEVEVMSALDLLRELMQPQVHIQHTEIVRKNLIKEPQVAAQPLVIDQPLVNVRQQELFLSHEMRPPSVFRQGKEQVQSSVLMQETFQPQSTTSTPDTMRAQPNVSWTLDVRQRPASGNSIGNSKDQSQEILRQRDVLLSHQMMLSSVIRQNAVQEQNTVKPFVLKQETVQPQVTTSPLVRMPSLPSLIKESQKESQPLEIAQPQEIVLNQDEKLSHEMVPPSFMRQDSDQGQDNSQSSVLMQETVRSPTLSPEMKEVSLQDAWQVQDKVQSSLSIQEHVQLQTATSPPDMMPVIKQDELQVKDIVQSSVLLQEKAQPQASTSTPGIIPAKPDILLTSDFRHKPASTNLTVNAIDQPQEHVRQQELLLSNELTLPSVIRHNAVQEQPTLTASVLTQETYQLQSTTSPPEIIPPSVIRKDVVEVQDILHTSVLMQENVQLQTTTSPPDMIPDIRQDAVNVKDKEQSSVLMQETDQLPEIMPPSVIRQDKTQVEDKVQDIVQSSVLMQEHIKPQAATSTMAIMLPSVIRQVEAQVQDTVPSSALMQEQVQPHTRPEVSFKSDVPQGPASENRIGHSIGKPQETVRQQQVLVSHDEMIPPSVISQDALEVQDILRSSELMQQILLPKATTSPPDMMPAQPVVSLTSNAQQQPNSASSMGHSIDQEILRQQEVPLSKEMMPPSVIRQDAWPVQDMLQSSVLMQEKKLEPTLEMMLPLVIMQDRVQTPVLMQNTVQPQSTTSNPEIMPAQADVPLISDVRQRSAGANRIWSSLRKALTSFRMRSQNIRPNADSGTTPIIVNVLQKPATTTDQIRMTPAFNVPSGNPQCEYCESADQCKDEKRPYCYHSHACARRVCQSL